MEIENFISEQSRLEVKKLELRSRRRVNNDLIGRYRSSFRGSGLLFSDLRLYEPGDDVKNIHWKVTARTGRPYIKTFEEERQLNVLLAVDLSNSTNFGSGRTNHQKALEFAALIVMLTQKTKDSCGLLLFTDKIIEFIKPSSKRTQFNRIFSALISVKANDRGTDIDAALKFLSNQHKRSSVIFIISDFITDDFSESLKLLGSRHDVIGVNLVTHDNLPSAGLVEFEGAEGGGRILIDTQSDRVREELKLQNERRSEELKKCFKEARADLIEIGSSVMSPLVALMSRRSNRH